MTKRGKKGQLTVFIIIGVVVIGAVLFLFLGRKIPGIGPSERQKIDVEGCIEDSVDNALRLVLSQGGVANPTNYWEYKGNKLAFLCYTNEFSKKCINQVPFLGLEVQRGIEEFARGNVEDCFFALEQEYKDRGYQVVTGNLNFGVEIVPEKMLITVQKKITLTKDQDRQVYENFNLVRTSGLFYLLNGVHDIIENEASKCNFDVVQYSLTNPQFKVSLNTIGTEIKVYTINYKKTNEEMSFAIRSCAASPDII